MSKSSTHVWSPEHAQSRNLKAVFTDFAGCIWKCKVIYEQPCYKKFRIVSKNQRDLIPRLVRLTVRPRSDCPPPYKLMEKYFNFQSEEALLLIITDLKIYSYSAATYFLEFQEPTRLIYSIPVLTSIFASDFKSLLDSGNFSDVKIRAGDLEVDAHKIILASRSPVFKAMFSHESRETIENVVEITDFDADIVQKLLDYIYSDYVDLHEKSEDVRTQLYQAADKYQLDRLKSLCEDMLVRNLTIKNAVGTLILADLHKSPELKKKVFRYLIVNKDEISKIESWPRLLEYPKLLSEVLLANQK